MLWLNEFWTREQVEELADDYIFVFGDNLEEVGRGGQAVIRGLPNAYGVPTKKSPTLFPEAFFTDDEYEANCRAIRVALSKIPTNRPWVTHSEIGKGLAKLDRCAPLTYQYLVRALRSHSLNGESSEIVTLRQLQDHVKARKLSANQG